MAANTALEAMNEALGTPSAEATPNADTELENQTPAADAAGDGDSAVAAGDDQDAAGAAESDDAEAGSGEAADGDGGKGEGGEADSQLVRDPVTGKFVKKPDAPAVDKDGKPIPADKDGKGAAAAAKKQPDPINDPIPKDLKQETQDRMRSLIKVAKEVTNERDTYKRDFDYIIEGVRATGTTSEQYGELLSFMALFNSGDVAQQTQALEILEGVADRLATLVGKERTVSDPLANHPDLREAVAKGQITAAYAKQLATMKNQGSLRTELTTAATAAQTAEQAAAQEKEQARADLNTLEETLRAADPQYEAKKAQIVPILKPIFATIRPSEWKGSFEKAYKNATVAKAPAAKPKSVPANQPLRAGGGGGNGAGGPAGNSGMNKAAGSALDAMNAALSGMRR